LNPIIDCGSTTWLQWTVLEHILPRAMQYDPHGQIVASPTLSGAPTIANGGLVPGPPFRITFRISDRAVWADGSPITSADFAFTWRAIMHTRGSIWTDTYRRIVGVDDADPTVAVVTLDEPWAGWPELFGGAHGFILERAAFG